MRRVSFSPLSKLMGRVAQGICGVARSGAVGAMAGVFTNFMVGSLPFIGGQESSLAFITPIVGQAIWGGIAGGLTGLAVAAHRGVIGDEARSSTIFNSLLTSLAGFTLSLPVISSVGQELVRPVLGYSATPSVLPLYGVCLLSGFAARRALSSRPSVQRCIV